MTLMIMGAIMIFLSTLLGVFLLVLSMPIIFNFITNEIWLEKLFLRFGKENFSFALIKLKNNLMSNLVIYVFFGILITLFFVLVTIVISQIRHRKNHKVAIRLFYTNFALTGIIFTILVLMIIFTGIWWFSFILAVLAMGLFFLQNSFLSLIKNSINHKEYQIGNIITTGDGKISNENYLDINNEIVNIRKNSIQAQQSLSLVKEQLHSEFLNDKDYETNEINNNKLVVNSKASLPDILNPMLLKENEDDGDAVGKIIAEPIYHKIKTDEMLFNSEQRVASNEQQQLDSKNNVISSDEQKEADDKEQVDINKENLQVKQQEECSYVAPSELEYNDVKQPLMSNSSQTGNGEYGSGKQLFTNEYYQGQQYSQVQEQIVALGEQKEADDKNQVDINNEYLQVEQPQCSYVAPSELEYDDGKQPLMSNSSQTGNGEYGFGKQLFTNEYYQGQQYSQVQEQIAALGERKEADDTNIEPNKIYYHLPMTRRTGEIDPQKTRKFLFANLPGKPDELESPVYEYNPIEEQDKKPKQDKKKNHESRSYGIFDQTIQRQANPVGIQEAVSYPQGYVQARYQTKSNYYKQPALNINLPNQETYNKSVVNQQFDAAVIAEHYHLQYPNYIFTNDSCPICYQGG
ncbi:hypothetical protein [Spiroplasma endosymbiont of Calodromius spilotus]